MSTIPRIITSTQAIFSVDEEISLDRFCGPVELVGHGEVVTSEAS